MHWAAKYVGMPYQPGGRGPQFVDCWGLLRLVYFEQFKIELPLLGGLDVGDALCCGRAIKEAQRGDWEAITTPFDGCAVGMSQKNDNVLHHVGVYCLAGGGKILHTHEKMGVIADSNKAIALKGFRSVLFFRHKLWPTSLKSLIHTSPAKV